MCPLTGLEIVAGLRRGSSVCVASLSDDFSGFFTGFGEADMSYLLILGLMVLWTSHIQASCMKTVCLRV